MKSTKRNTPLRISTFVLFLYFSLSFLFITWLYMILKKSFLSYPYSLRHSAPLPRCMSFYIYFWKYIRKYTPLLTEMAAYYIHCLVPCFLHFLYPEERSITVHEDLCSFKGCIVFPCVIYHNLTVNEHLSFFICFLSEILLQ